MRISVSNWSTTEADADQTTRAILDAAAAEAAAASPTATASREGSK
jgi:hypothetical protein